MQIERDTVEVGPFEFERGGRVPDLELAYETYGEYDGDNAVLVCHALTGSANVAGEPTPDAGTAGQAQAWWDGVVGPGKPIDTEEYYVVCVNVPGSCYGSTGPASIDPRTGEPYGPDFPAVTVGDWTRAQRIVLEYLGVERLHAVTGGSVGGMNALEWAKRFPGMVDRVAPIATAPRLDPQCLALNAIAARAITSDPDWRGGRYYGETHPDDGLALARMLGHVMYLSKDSMHAKFGRRPAPADAPTPADPSAATTPTEPLADAFPYRDVASYLDYNADRFVDRFDANSYLYLLHAMDHYDLAAGAGSDAAALADFEGELFLLSFTGDWHFTVRQAEGLAESCRAAGVSTTHRVVDSEYGHDAFLAQPDRVGPPLERFLAGESPTDAPSGTPGEAHPRVHTGLFCD